jgi:Sin3a-like protein
MSIQLLDRDSPQFEKDHMTPEQRFYSYITSFSSVFPTEGVTVSSRYQNMRWPSKQPHPETRQPTTTAVATAENGDEDKPAGADGENAATAEPNATVDEPVAFDYRLTSTMIGFRIVPENFHVMFEQESAESAERPSELLKEKILFGATLKESPKKVEKNGFIGLDDDKRTLGGYDDEEAAGSADVEMDDQGQDQAGEKEKTPEESVPAPVTEAKEPSPAAENVDGPVQESVSGDAAGLPTHGDSEFDAVVQDTAE